MPLSGLRIPKPSTFLSHERKPAAQYASTYFLGDADSAHEQQARAQAAGEQGSPSPLGTASSGTEVPAEIAESIGTQRGGGSPLPQDTRSQMERRFGRSLSQVRIHHDSQSDALNKDLSSAAFTVGKDIFFRGGQFRPNQPEGKQLLQHELSHTMQSTQPGLIQRELFTQRQVSEKVSIWGRWRSGAYGEIVEMFGLWHQGVKTQPLSTKLFFLQTLLTKIDAYIASKQAKQSGAGEEARTARAGRIGKMQEVRENVASELSMVDSQASQTPETQPTLQDMDRGPLSFVPDGIQTGGALNKLYEVDLDASQGTTGLFKPEKEEDATIAMTKGARAGIPTKRPNQTGRSVGAYRIAQLLGSDLIPETAYGSVDYTATDQNGQSVNVSQSGSVMKRLQGAKPGAETDFSYDLGRKYNMRDEHSRELSKLYLLDMIIGQVDRHEQNFMVADSGPRVWGIDNDLAFGKNYTVDPKKGTTRVDTFGKTGSDIKVDPAFANEIIKLARHPDWVEDALRNLELTDEEIAAAVERLKNLALYLTRRLAKNENLWT
jgi:hypothetical protein